MRILETGGSSVLPDAMSQRHGKLVDAAQQFEASLMQELLKPMRHGQDSWGGDAPSDDDSSDAISSFGTEAMAKAISQGGGFGIAKQVISQVTSESDRLRNNKSARY